jgi:hypothetical protein
MSFANNITLEVGSPPGIGSKGSTKWNVGASLKCVMSCAQFDIYHGVTWSILKTL